MSKRIWIAIVIVIALFAIVVGGMLWPRPQFQKGPWATPGAEAPPGTPAENIPQ